MLEFLVGGGSGYKEAFAITAGGSRQLAVMGDNDSMEGRVFYPAVSRPTIRVPAMVAWHIGITSCSSASKTLRMTNQYLNSPIVSISCAPVEVL